MGKWAKYDNDRKYQKSWEKTFLWLKPIPGKSL